jgi:uncharacterized DUF497 family protein
MYDRILKQMREKIRTCQYVMTIHAEEEMADDNLSIFDVEHVVLTGSVIERQKDQDTAERKYLVEGETIPGNMAVVVGKISITGKLMIISVYREWR